MSPLIKLWEHEIINTNNKNSTDVVLCKQTYLSTFIFQDGQQMKMEPIIKKIKA